MSRGGGSGATDGWLEEEEKLQALVWLRNVSGLIKSEAFRKTVGRHVAFG